jgi:ribonuclease HI
MQKDWLFDLQLGGGLEDQEALVAQALAADPAAGAIPAEDAEAFVAACYVARMVRPHLAAKLWQACGIRVSHQGEKARRRSTIRLMKRWAEPKVRDLLIRLIPSICIGPALDPEMHPDRWADERMAEIYSDKVSIMWLLMVRRYLGRTENESAWLESLSEYSGRHYRLWLAVGRLALRKLVFTEQKAAARALQKAAAGAQATLVQELRHKDRLTGALRQDVRRLERDRSQLKQRARRAEQAAREMLSQARGDVAAAHRALQERMAAQEQELAARAHALEAQVASIREQLAAERVRFAATLSRIAASHPLHLLQGRTITVLSSEPGSTEVHRLLVESLGGRFLPEGGEVAIEAPAGIAALERRLRGLAMERVLLKCDGLYRRRQGRHGIAISGFQVQIGGSVIARQSGLVCCGPAAGSLMAEYGAAAMALSWLLAMEPAPGSKLEIWSDCKSLLSRLRKRHPVRRKLGCVMLDRQVRMLRRQLEKRGCEVGFRWVPREEVHAVDRLCDQAYWQQRWYHRPTGKPGASLKSFLRSHVRPPVSGRRQPLTGAGSVRQASIAATS